MALRRLTRDYVAGHWEPSIGTHLSADHYRETAPGRRHAVCPEKSSVCDVHVDKYNAHSEMAKHLVHEAPEVPVALGAGILFGSNHYAKTNDVKASIIIGGVSAGITYGVISILRDIFKEA